MPSHRSEHSATSQSEAVREPQATTLAGLDWAQPDDDADKFAQALVLFERSLAALVRTKLIELHGDAWLRRGCGSHRATWRDRATKSNAEVGAETLLGYAHFGEYREIIVSRTNWQAFSSTFHSTDFVKKQFAIIEPFRNSTYHPAERTLYAAEHPAAFMALSTLSGKYHEDTANRINNLFIESVEAGATDDEPSTIFSLSMKNFSSLPERSVIGRDAQFAGLADFFGDEFASVASVNGHGGVGKTALVEEFLRQILAIVCRPGTRPNPEAVVFLTAKDNWLEWLEEIDGRQRPSPSQRFQTLRAVYQSILRTCGDDADSDDLPMPDLRRRCLSLMRDMHCLLVLDNLESLDESEIEQVSVFLQEIPSASKAIVTDRMDRGVGRKFPLTGLVPEAAVELMRTRLGTLGVDLPTAHDGALRRIATETGGVPLHLLYCVGGIAAGHDPIAALDRLRGADALELLRFSFDSSIKALSADAAAALVMACSLTRPMRRNDLHVITADEARDAALRELIRASFVERVTDEGPVSFRVTSMQLREHVRLVEQELVSAQTLAAIRRRAPSRGSALQPNVEVAVTRALEEADRLRPDFTRSAALLEAESKKLGDHPRLLGALGYYHYRLHRRREARTFLNQAIAGGSQDPKVFETLALVCLFDREYEPGRVAIDAALALSPGSRSALQTQGQILMRSVEANRLMMDESALDRDIALARTALQASLYDEDRTPGQRAHNERTRGMLDRLDRLTR